MPFRLPKIIVVDTYGILAGILNNAFQDTIVFLVHVVARVKHKSIRTKGLNLYLMKVQNIN